MTTRVLASAVDPSVLNQLREDLGEDSEVRGLVDLFIEDARVRCGTITDAYARGDAAALARNAHGLKGSAANVGAAALASLCADIERVAKSGTVTGTPIAFLEEERQRASDALLRLRDSLGL